MPAKQISNRDRRFRLLFEEHPQPMWILDADTATIRAANAAAESLFGYSRGELDSKPVTDLLTSTDAEGFLEQVRVRGPGTSTAWKMKDKQGSSMDVDMTVHDIQYCRRGAQLAVLMDATGMRRLEDQLRQAQKMEAIGMLAGGVAHDFNNLLTIISGYTQLMLTNLQPSDPNRHSAEQILKAGERAAALTRQLLAFSRRQVLQLKVIDLNQLVSGLSAMLRRLIGEDIELHLATQPDLGRVSADPGQLEQVIMNLVVNARDAMPKGGSLTIETRNGDLDENYTATHIAVKPGPYVMLSVSDTGSGIDKATRERLFDPFFTTKASGKGTGLGLSTVFGIVKQSGGTLEVHSEPGRGTSVMVYLPRIDQPAAADPTAAVKKAVRRGVETILLVEDEDMVRALVRETLQREGYRVLEAASPVEARGIADQHKGPIHLLITDVVMPKLSGRELAEELVKRRPDLKVIYMSGYTDSAVVNSGVLSGEVAFLQKPFTPHVLAEKVREVLENRNGRTTSCAVE